MNHTTERTMERLVFWGLVTIYTLAWTGFLYITGRVVWDFWLKKVVLE